jgi:hypothetical protein
MLALNTTGVKLSLGEIDADLKLSFNDLPSDDHLPSRFPYRSRRYSRCHFTSGAITWLSENPFYQSAEYNPLAAGQLRMFHPLKEQTKDKIASVFIPAVAQHVPGDRFTIGVHQIRIIATDQEMGKPAPEGIHRDGFDFVAVVAVSRKNVNGGVTMLVDLEDHDKVFFEETLETGGAILFDDRQVAHYTTPITPRYPGLASRDVFVLTFSILQSTE